MQSHSNVIVLASGGTGGHIFPAEALAEALKERGYKPVLITDKRFGQYGGALKQQEFHIIRASVVGGSISRKIKGIVQMTLGYFEARKLLDKLQPQAVIGFGGYPSFATMMAACHKKIPTLIHEQNSVIGRANAVLASKVRAIATSFPEVAGIADKDRAKVTFTGNPVRPGIKALRNMEYPHVGEGGMLKILVTGGSQGASVFSRVMPEAMKLLSEASRRRIRIDQQCRAGDIAEARRGYEGAGVNADLTTFFTDMPARLAVANLVVARSGASTLAELAVSGRPAILVPYPYLKDDSQTTNARSLEAIGGGWVMPENGLEPKAIAAKIEDFLAHPDALVEAAAKARGIGMPDADKALATLVEGIVKKEREA